MALGSPLGREVAPREMGALGAGMVARKLGLLADETRTLVACGAGAGLAAVYNVPLAGALFSLEVMLLSFSWEKTLAAIITSAIAAWTATLGLGEESPIPFYFRHPAAFISLVGDYRWPHSWRRGLALSQSDQHGSLARSKQLADAGFLSAGVFPACRPQPLFPQLPGNGKGPMQLALSDELGFPGAAMLLALKMVVILAVLRGGAEGGLLTPGLAVGGLTSLLLCMLWQQLLPGRRLRQFCSRRRGGVSRRIHADAAHGGRAGDGVHPHGSQLSGPHAAVRRRGIFNLPDIG
ncbi:chloride transporter, chloride channel (ClC) family protein [Klebsiella michiganensis]|uniref:Chloride transporter, chloride channel (ClC) family protein n=1 Tax=Klebsiella michiganensis TaxID=1134687 RepID=A0A7H4PFC8_9ENTR|nr:chloride transporter, chloride channel (ClC) family protein [Klebsiella michiganensis]